MSLRERLSERGVELGDEVGRGATAVVYRAIDRRHDRPVAVKVFRPGAGAELGPDRFLREIQLAAGLQHPHILPVYDSGAADGTLFYVMPYVEGESLRQRLARGRLPVDEALRIARQVADALGFAHARGVVHRDIKPENILLEGRHAVVADFGVALAVERPPGDGRITSVGLVVGSPAYMSPEQASGDAAVDGRSDIYSLGCVLYEMLAGEPPFPGPSPRAIVARRFQGPPTPVIEHRPEVSAAVSAAVQRALAVDPERGSGGRRTSRRRCGRRRLTAGSPASAWHGSVAVGSRWWPAGWLSRRSRCSRATGRLRGRRGSIPGASRSPRSATRPVSAASPRSAPMVAAWITDRLGEVQGVEVVQSAIVMPAQHDQHTMPGAWDDPARLHTLAAETRAGTLVTGSYYRGDQGVVEFHVEIIDANSGEVLRAIGPVESRESSERVADELSRAVAGAVDTAVALLPRSPRVDPEHRESPNGIQPRYGW